MHINFINKFITIYNLDYNKIVSEVVILHLGYVCFLSQCHSDY